MPTMSKEYMKVYLHEKHNETINCEKCGGQYKKYFVHVHQRSKKHKEAINKENTEEEGKTNLEIESMKNTIMELKALLKAQIIFD
jgi:hypothetical protein